MVGLVHGKALFDVGRKRTARALVRPWVDGTVVAIMPVEVPFVRRAEVTVVALDHRHGVVLDVFGVPRSHMRHVVAFHAAEKFFLQVGRLFVPVHQGLAVTTERTHRTPDVRGRLFLNFDPFLWF